MSRFRGKKWSQLRLEDINSDDGNARILSPAAFHYFTPGLMLIELDNPENGFIPNLITERLTTSDFDKDENIQRAREYIRRLSRKQRQVTIGFIQHLEPSAWFVPEIARSAVENLLSGDVRPYSLHALEDWLETTFGYRGRITARREKGCS